MAWGTANFADYPWRSEKNLWVALATEVLLQRTRATQVVPAYSKLKAQFPDPEAVIIAPQEAINDLFAPLGLHWRARYFQMMADHVRMLGGVPRSPALLLALPAVGPYASAAFLSLHLDRRAVIIDGNVVRWLGRFFGFSVHRETRRKPWLRQLADRLTPRRNVRRYNYAVLDLTMTLCGVRPHCDECPLATLPCEYWKSNAPADLSPPTRKAPR